MNTPKFSVSEFIATCNQTLDYAYNSVIIEGEVSSFKVNQGKWVFFDLKDAESSLNCFMVTTQLRTPLSDGLRVLVRGVPKLTKWGKFSFTVQNVMPVGVGSIKKSFDLLQQKLAAEGLFDPSRKRPLPSPLSHIGVISSTAAAGYADFIKILNERWGGLTVQVAHTQVQGLDAPDQIIRALQYFNQSREVELILILRGGGSADDLAAFNDEQLVRAIATSRLPVVTGIGHEVDRSLADLVADLAASTPSNAAQLITPDRHSQLQALHSSLQHLERFLVDRITEEQTTLRQRLGEVARSLNERLDSALMTLAQKQQLLTSLNPETILQRGYAIISGDLAPNSVVTITTSSQLVTAQVQTVRTRKTNPKELS